MFDVHEPFIPLLFCKIKNIINWKVRIEKKKNVKMKDHTCKSHLDSRVCSLSKSISPSAALGTCGIECNRRAKPYLKPWTGIDLQ